MSVQSSVRVLDSIVTNLSRRFKFSIKHIDALDELLFVDEFSGGGKLARDLPDHPEIVALVKTFDYYTEEVEDLEEEELPQPRERLSDFNRWWVDAERRSGFRMYKMFLNKN